MTSFPFNLKTLADERLHSLEDSFRRMNVSAHDFESLSFKKLISCSDFAYQSIRRQPSLIVALANNSLKIDYDKQYYSTTLEKAVGSAKTQVELIKILRGVKRREMLRIAWRDIADLSSFNQTVTETSNYADAVLQSTLSWLYRHHCETRGIPCDKDGNRIEMIVLALGKLGAQELNFSSDIDLIFSFATTGNTVGTKRELSNNEFFIQLAQRYIKVLSLPTEDGFVFRVDMRLRPFGSGGPLVTTLAALEDYYQIHGRDWERYAFIRARCVAGDMERGNRFLHSLRPFVYRRYLDFGALESLREMKAMIRSEVERHGMEANIKLGPGGIREAEFVVQAFQMVRGGKIAELRDRQILSVLRKLGHRNLLPTHAVRELEEAYIFLRTVEHRLQQVDDQQTHTIPDDEVGRARLATGLNRTDWHALERTIRKHRERIQSHFDQIFGPESETKQSSEAEILGYYWTGGLSEDQIVDELRNHGFIDPDQTIEILSKLRASYAIRGLSERGRQRMGRLMPALLRTVGTRQDQIGTLKRVVTVIESIARRSAYLALLTERPLALSQLVQLCEASSMVTRQFAKHPLVLDELLDSRSLYASRKKKDLIEEIDARLGSVTTGDVENEMDVLRQFHHASVLRIAAADIAKSLSVTKVSTRLTELAEVCIQTVLNLSYRDMIERYGRPRYTDQGQLYEAPFAIIAYGTFGGGELGYGSDLDLVFLHGSRGDNQFTNGTKVVENSVFFSRLAQRIIHMLSTATADGKLYESDTRLRPSGADGLLVSSIDAFDNYQHRQAWVWEHQALVRARFVAGSEILGEKFENIRLKVLTKERQPKHLLSEVRNMRTRMRAELGTKEITTFDIKRGEGGIADIEFMV